jgi:hypothetical protein
MGLASSRTVRALSAAAIAALTLIAGVGDAQAFNDQPQVAVDRDGTAHFTWRRFDGIDTVRTRARTPNGTLGAVQDLSAAGQDAQHPALALDPQGNAYYVWVRFNGTHDIVQARKRNANGTLGAVQDLSPAGRNAFQPRLAVDSQGNAYFTWLRFNGTNFIVQARKRNANGTLGAVQDLSPSGRDAGGPALAVDPQGNSYFVWERFNGAEKVVQFRRRAADGTLGPVQRLSVPGENAFNSDVAVDALGNAYFAWERIDGSSAGCCRIAQTRRRAAGGALDAVQDLSAAGAEAFAPHLAIDPQGNVSFTWSREGVVQTRLRPAGGVLGAVQDLANGFFPQVAVDPTGTASFVWAGPDALANDIARTRRRTAEGLLSAEQDLSLTGKNVQQQQLAVDPLGNAYFVWARAEVVQTRKRAPDGTLTAVQIVAG